MPSLLNKESDVDDNHLIEESNTLPLRITNSTPYMVKRTISVPERCIEKYDMVIAEMDSGSQGQSVFSIVWFLMKQPIKVIKTLYAIVKLIESLKMSNWKTTVASIVQALALVMGLFGINISPENQTLIITLIGTIYAIVGVIKGYLTQDKPSVPPLPKV